jgi:hypothetical protein
MQLDNDREKIANYTGKKLGNFLSLGVALKVSRLSMFYR